MDPYKFIEKYYSDNRELKRILITHSEQVAEKALKIAQAHPEFNLDTLFLEEAALLHDIGIYQTNAPAIHCYGTSPYLQHGLLGAELLRAEGYPGHARVCERHTGTGLTKETIERQRLPLPSKDFSPETWEEKVICFADKFFSKTRLGQEKTPEQALHSLQKFGPESVARFTKWMELFL